MTKTLYVGYWRDHEDCGTWEISRDGNHGVCGIHATVFELPTYEEIHNL